MAESHLSRADPIFFSLCRLRPSRRWPLPSILCFLPQGRLTPRSDALSSIESAVFAKIIPRLAGSFSPNAGRGSSSVGSVDSQRLTLFLLQNSGVFAENFSLFSLQVFTQLHFSLTRNLPPLLLLMLHFFYVNMRR